ncbi:hypothetical protein AB9K27_08275 [Klebsiella quasipneumoniae]
MNVQNIQDVKNKNTSNSLDLFVEKMKFIALNEVSIPWDSDRWVIKNVAIKFTKISDNALHNEKMNSDFIKFSKAYIINETPCKTHRLQMIIPTLRCLEHVLIKNYSSGNICNVNYSILGEVIDLIKHKYSVSYICAISGELKKIVSFLNQNNFTYKYIGGWKSPIKDNRNYFKSNDEQSKKLPSEDVMYIFADIFRQDLTDVRDIFTTSIFALLMSAPSRISEVLSLSIDCMFTNKTRKGDQKWGLRFWAGKGFGGDIKWIPSTMVPVTQKAIYRIIEITKEARKFAKLMELDFKSFHKQSKFKEYAENKVLSAIQICEILFNDTFSEKRM